MKKKLLVIVLATLTTSAFAGGAMDFTIPESTKTGASAVSDVASAQATRATGTTSAATAPTRAVNAVQPVRVMSSAATNQANAVARSNVSAAPETARAANPQVAPIAKDSAQPAMPASAATAASGVAADASVDANGNAVNPFTGKSLSEEDLQRQLEASKARTALLEEQLKQVTLSADIANVPIKKRAEVAKLELPPPVPASAPVAPKPVKHVKKHVEKKTPAVEVVGPRMPNVRLDGVVVNEGVASAILDVDGNSSVVANGGSTPFGQVKVLNATSALVGGMALHVSEDTTIARVHISDPKPVDPKASSFPSLPVANMPVAASSSAGHPLPPVPVPLPPPTTATTVAH